MPPVFLPKEFHGLRGLAGYSLWGQKEPDMTEHEVKSLSRVQLFATPWTEGSSHRIFQARVLEWVAISFSRGSSLPRDQTQVSLIVSRRSTV